MNLTDFSCFSFPGGERHFELSDAARERIHANGSSIRAVLRHSDDVMDLSLATEWLGRQGLKPRRLLLPYIPYARQDRPTTDRSPFSLKWMAWLINALNYDYVHVFEPHSDVAAGLIRNVEVLSMQGMVRQVIESLQAPTFDQELLLLAPDAGASKRVSGILHHCLDRPCIGKLLPEMGQALKHRDPATGRLKVSFVSENVRGRRVLIVDDICDGGATFVELAHVLKQMEVKEIHLVVAHGIFSKSINPLVEAGISTIHASDSLHQSSITHRIRLNDHLSYWPMTST